MKYPPPYILFYKRRDILIPEREILHLSQVIFIPQSSSQEDKRQNKR